MNVTWYCSTSDTVQHITNLFLAITTGKKRYSCLSGKLCWMLYQFLVLTGNWQFFCCDGKFSLRPEKKETVICLAGARSITTGKKKIQSSVCWVRGSGDYDRKKKRFSCLSGGCAINYDRKKKIQSSVCWMRSSGDYEKKKIHYDRKKKMQSSV